jgi:hypothetical protein
MWVLEASLPTPDGEAIGGDLYEEFREHIVPRRGLAFARVWYWWQVTRSLSPLFFRSWQRASVTRASAAMIAAAVSATIPASVLLTLRSFVLSQVPLKTTPDVSFGFLALLIGLMLISGVFGLAVGIRLLQRR